MAKLDYLRILALSIKETTSNLEELLDKGFLEHLQSLARFLITLKKPNSMSRVEFYVLKREATKYSVRNR